MLKFYHTIDKIDYIFKLHVLVCLFIQYNN